MATQGAEYGQAIGTYADPSIGDVDTSGSFNTQHPGPRGARPSLLPASDMFDILSGWFKADASHAAEWRILCNEWFDFRAGDQWSPEDRQLLNAQQRPHIVFNRVLTILKAVAGMEINGRHEIHFIPRNTETAEVNELLSAASKWMADGCDAEDEESQAFEDCLTVGVGFVECRLDYEDDQKGKYLEEMVDPREMYWDRTSRKKNMTEARRMARKRKMTLGEAMQMFPGKTRVQLDAAWAIGTEMDEAKKTLEEKRKREENTTDTTYDDQIEVTIVQMQWFERETYYLVADDQQNEKVELTEEKYRTWHARMQMIEGRFPELKMPVAVKMTRKIFKQAWIGSEILKVDDAPIEKQYSWAAQTGELHRTKGMWFGLVHVMRDPQMWANKWLSQSLHIMNSTAKGGILAETDAFEDQRQAEETYARPDSITWMAEKALSGQSPKVMPKPGQGFPNGHIELMQFAITAIRDVTGINLELLGLRDVNQPGILEAMRKQAGMTVLATQFDSLRRFRKLVGRKRLYFIQNFFADGRLIRVVGQDGADAITLLQDKCLGEDDVVVDDTPTSPNQKEANWGIISQFLPLFKEELAAKPEMLALILEYSPLPARLVEAIKKLAEGTKQQDPKEQVALAAGVATVAKLQSEADLNKAKAGGAQATAVYDMAVAQNLAKKNDSSIDTVKEMVDAAHTVAKIEGEKAKADKTKADTALVHASIPGEQARTVQTHVDTARAAIEPIPHHHDAFPKKPSK